MTDWYERRHELREGDIFTTRDGDLIRLDRRVPGDGTKWYYCLWYSGHWNCDDGTLEKQ